VSKVFPAESVVEEAIKLGHQISKLSLPVVQMCKEAVNNGKQFVRFTLKWKQRADIVLQHTK
jgi:hypothetical protein